MSLVPATAWSNRPTRKLEAVRAAHEGDLETLLELLSFYLAHKSRKERAVSPETLRTYATGIRKFWAWLRPDGGSPRVGLLELAADDLELWLGELSRDEGLGNNTRATYLAGVLAVLRALNWAGARSAPEPVPAPVRSARLKGFSPGGLESAYNALLKGLEETSEPEDLRDRVAVRLLGQAGLRLAEAVAVRTDDLQLEHRLLFVAHGKGDKARWVPLTSATVKAIKEWLRARAALSPASDHLLVNLGGRRAHGRGMTPRTLWAHLDRRYQEMGLELKGAHILRHRAGTRFQKDGKDIYKTARLLGHANIQTSTLYAEAQVGELAEVMEMQGE